MLTVSRVTTDIVTTITAILGEGLDEDTDITEDSILTDIGLNSLMLARVIVNLEERFGHDPFLDGSHAIVDIHTVGDLVAAYAEARPHVTKLCQPTPVQHGSVIELESVEDYLGPAKQRFFGNGYRRPTYRVQPVDTDNPSDLVAAVDVTYPEDWSLKRAGSDLRPHLSTVDVMILSVRSAEALLACLIGLTPVEVQGSMIRKLSVRAGSRPEESLLGLPLRATLRNTVPASDGEAGEADSTITVQVGVMQARVVLRHPARSASHVGAIDFGHFEERPSWHWGSGYRQDEQSIRAVLADTESLSAHASIGLHHNSVCGTRASHAPGPATLIDAFVTLLQLGQVLMYELDQIERARSDTLWMQQLVLCPSATSASEEWTSEERTSAELRIAQHQLLDLPSGTWRNLNFEGESGGIAMTAAFAHRIPNLEGSLR